MLAIRLGTFAALFALGIGCTPNELGNLEAQRRGDLTYAPAPHADFDLSLTDACGPGGRTDLGHDAIDRAPYLQQVTDHSAMVLWTSAVAEAPIVSITRPGTDERIDVAAAVDDSASPANGAQYIAALESLEPGTTYCYEIEDAGRVVYGSTGFKTAPATGTDGPVQFIAMGDLGERTGDQFAVLEQLEGVSYDFGLLTGDIAYTDGTLAQYEANYFDVYADIIDKVAMFPASGNHDYGTRSAGPFREVFALPENGGPGGRERWYSFDWGNVHVIVLDTEQVGQAQADWADADLAATDLPWKIAVLHRPAYSSGYHGSDASVRNTFGPMLERHGVQLALFGHDHHYERTEPIAGVTYVVAGAGGIGTRPAGQSSFTAFSEPVSHFVYVSIEGDTLTGYAIDATGQLFDTLQIALGD